MRWFPVAAYDLSDSRAGEQTNTAEKGTDGTCDDVQWFCAFQANKGKRLCRNVRSLSFADGKTKGGTIKNKV